jgi:hypothetical protein
VRPEISAVTANWKAATYWNQGKRMAPFSAQEDNKTQAGLNNQRIIAKDFTLWKKEWSELRGWHYATPKVKRLVPIVPCRSAF